MSIRFEKVRWKNFLSTGNNFIEINLEEAPTTLIVGTNGTGKSTLLDAISYALFGKAFRKINKPQLINSINEKDCVVEIEFVVNNTKYSVRRGMKPTIFEIYVNGKLIDQSANIKDHQEHLENTILKLNFKSFSQVVVLGSSTFVPFMQLSAADRRFIIEDILDIKIFSAMNVVLKNRIAEIRSEKDQLSHKIDLETQKRDMVQRHIDELKKNTQERVKEIEAQIDGTMKEIEEIQKTISSSMDKVSELTKSHAPASKVNKTMVEVEDLQKQLKNSIKKLLSEKQFFETTQECPTCSQPLSNELSEQKVTEKEQKILEVNAALVELKEKYDALEKKRIEYNQISDDIRNLQESVRGLQSQIDLHQSYVVKLNKELKGLSSGKSTDGVSKYYKELKDVEKTLVTYEEKNKDLTEKRYYYDVSAVLLRDNGIKTKIIKQYLPIINKLVNHYLSELDFFVNFTLDESFSETIKSRYRDIFSYASFSEGQKKRIDLALLFTWRDIAKLKNSANTNLLILDEVFDSAMDSQGIEDFMKLVNNLGESVNVFVISPKGDALYDKFGRVIRFEMKGNFSRMVE